MNEVGGKMQTNMMMWGIIFFFFAGSASAAQELAAGMIKVSKGQVSILRSGSRLAAKPGDKVYSVDQVRTGADGAVGITLKDNTLLSAGPNSLISLDKFSFDSKTHAGAISVGIKRGTLAVATGKIAKQTPESIDFHTPSSILGVRGTEFVIEVVATEED